MFRLKKEIYIDKRHFDSALGLRSRLMDIVRQNYTEYNVSREAITFYASGGFNFNRGIEGSVLIKEDSSNYCVIIQIKKTFLVPLLIFAVIVVMVMSNTFDSFDFAVFINRLLLFPVFFSPFLLLHWILFYFSASVKLKDFTAYFEEIL
jgi:hypothetical protein